MENVATAAQLKAAMKRRYYWADEWAAQQVQIATGAKAIVLNSSGALQVDVAPANAEMGPAGDLDFAILRLEGNHYEYYQAADGRSVFKFIDLPEVLRSRVLSSAGSWFAALGLRTLTSEGHTDGRGAVAGNGAPAPSRGIDAGDSESRSEKKPARADGKFECSVSDAESRKSGGGKQDTGARLVEFNVDTWAGCIEESHEGLGLEADKIKRALDREETREESHPNVYKWPTQEGRLMNEFGTDDIFGMAFPTVFPYGSGYEDHGAPRISLADWACFLMRHSSGVAASHPRLRYYLLNRVNRERAISTGRVFAKRNHGIETREDLEELLKDDGAGISKRLSYFASHIRGSPGAKYVHRSQMKELSLTIGPPTFFLTRSAADLHWSALHEIIKRHKRIGPDDKYSR